MTPMRILHVIGQRPEMTGSGIYLNALVRESEKCGFSTLKIAGVPSGRIDALPSVHPTRHRFVVFESEPLDFPVPGMSDVMPYRSSLFKDLKGRRLTVYKAAFGHVLQSAADQFQPDIVHTNHLFLLSALVRKVLPHLPVVATCHGTDLRQYNNCPHLRAYVRRHCGNLDRIIALTGDQKAEICSLYGIAPEKIAVVGGGYDQEMFTWAPKSPAGRVQILYAGKFNRSKGVPWLLKSLMKIRHHDWHLHMAGSGRGPEFDQCIDLAEQLGSKVTNHGYITHARLAELMKLTHVQVLPSFFEGLPLVLFEGLASGCRVITTDLSGFSEIFGEADRETVDRIQLLPLETIDRPFQKDEAQLEDALCQSILAMMAAVKKSPYVNDPQALRIASEYTWPRIFERTVSVYRDAIDSRGECLNTRSMSVWP